MTSMETIVRELENYRGPEIKLMEVCGTHTASIFKNGIRDLISPQIRLISGPGCPVCVTPAGYIDAAVEAAQKPGHVLLTFGDMMKVPGSRLSLSQSRAEGARVEVMYSPQEAVKRAKQEPDKTFVVAAIGFETTIPAYCQVLSSIRSEKIENICLHTALRRIIPALQWIADNEAAIDGYICPGHVSAIIGEDVYRPLAARIKKPMAIAGFTAEHILAAIYDLVKQLAGDRAEVHNLYPSVVSKEGNVQALEAINRCFRPGTARWRGLGDIVDSGYYLREEFAPFDAGHGRWEKEETLEEGGCRCGEVIIGRVTPPRCALFGTACTPLSPRGPCMVSAEGACGIWYKYRLNDGINDRNGVSG